ncbi:glycosyltransferase [uncultured Bacteroides sp.]|uniref:glycosyltransferase family 2 protein n=1 Tax=uncultured Bacteroides sp. TaxID=162156 RepID=UPI002AA5FCBF|nr:glycosyltransferase [uncultured Bacteroides sp.]
MNRPDSLDRTLKFMAEANDKPQQIVVVDQSQDADVQMQNQKVLDSYKDVIPSLVYEHQQAKSLTKARNLGLTKATNEILAFTDDDIDVNTDTFTNVAFIMSEQKIAMIAGIDEYTQQSSTDIGYILGTKSYRNRKIGHVTHSMLGRYPDNIKIQTETQWAQGYFFVVRKSLMKQWGTKWDENLTSYAYAEDLDFSYGYYKKAHAEGLRCVIDPRVKVKHLATLEYRIPGANSIYMYVINRAYLSHKHKMGVFGHIESNWCDFWRLVERIVKKQQSAEFFHAIYCKYKYRSEIYSGKLDYEKFMGK